MYRIYGETMSSPTIWLEKSGDFRQKNSAPEHWGIAAEFPGLTDRGTFHAKMKLPATRV